MEFTSPFFLLFLCITLILYYILPNKSRPLILLISGCYFYMSWNYKYILLLFSVMIISYLGAILIDIAKQNFTKKLILIICIVFELSFLFYFKYTNMLLDTLSLIRGFFQSTQQSSISLSILLPVGISFYTFQSIGYLIDIFQKKTLVEKNFITYGAFVVFFPQLVAGPIERSKNLLFQIKNSPLIKPLQENLSKGIFQMLWGYFEKIVIADRISVVVTTVYSDFASFSGLYILIATILFAIQIYCDFDGYTNIAIGVSRIFGIRLIKNFNAPYLSSSITEFWRNWHISLSSWLRDYIYIPLGGNRKGQLIKYRNLLITFFISGLWHGANWTFVIWGMIHGGYQIIEDIIKKFHSTPQKNSTNFSNIKKICRIFKTFICVDFAWLFFRANSIQDAINMIKHLFLHFDIFSITDRESAIRLGLTINEWIVLSISLLILLIIDLCKKSIDINNNKVELYDYIYSFPLLLKTFILILGILVIIIWGHYGPQYCETQFIYFQF